MLRLVVDGVFFQLNNTGIARVWHTVLQMLAVKRTHEIILLDRGGAPRIEGVTSVPFPAYSLSANSPADSVLIQQMCDHFKADVFSTTYYTSPLTTPMVMMVHDMIPELFGFNLQQRDKMDKELSIAYAQRFICVSHRTRHDLLSFYPEIPADRVVVAHNGVDEQAFHPRSPEAISAFRGKHGLVRPFFMFVGSRDQHRGYKNSQLFFRAIAGLKDAAFDVLCVGGERQMEPEIVACIPSGMKCIRLDLSDDDLSLAYCGAQALIYPSLYEGFGLPVIEAMASGCAVVTTPHGSLEEIAGSAAHVIDGFSVDEMRRAIHQLGNPDYRRDLIARGLEHARQFRWQGMVDALARQTQAVVEEGRTGAFDRFTAEWSRLRKVQGSVDFYWS